MIRIDYTNEPRKDILCIDVKSFFASVEAVKRGYHPLNAYIVVMSKPTEEGGLVLAASPKVKTEYGIQTGSRRFEIPKNSNIKIVEPRMGLYLKVNGMINDIYKEFVSESDLHVYSVDETFLDVTFSHALFGDTLQIARKIQDVIWKRLRLVVSVGIGDNPLLAKLALDNQAKHAFPFIAEWHYEDVPNTVWKIDPITEMWGIGKRTANNLHQLGIDSVYRLSQYNVQSLTRIHGVIGEQLFYHAHGVDHSVLSEKYIPLSNSYGKSQILDRDYTIQYEIEVVIREMADQVAARLRKYHVEAGVIHLTIGFSDEIADKGFSHQLSIFPTSLSKAIIDVCLYLFRTYYKGQPVRNLSIQSGKIQLKSHLQMNLFETPEETLRQNELELVIDRVRNKYGYSSLIHASSLTRGGTAITRSGLIGGHKG
ncbi:Y-family DNA polymerase [Desemzia sp. RIT804]|uniref:Y-family DNA polymerase n=1 Tax=Desemzia sp. RIT 804 TaxID=2810209 RepID=UPI001950708C|nr:Y-family DNA polymerase [Desemzia sp. RIT 804]MBM6614219.1 Y-family DNA polymerase [Desemzia sp. RIT 804]